MSLDLIILFIYVNGSLILLVSDQAVSPLCCALLLRCVAWWPKFLSLLMTICILVQQQSLFSPYHAQSACPESFCKFTVLNSLKSIPKKYFFHNTLIILANRTYTLIRIKQQTSPLNCIIPSTIPWQVTT